MIALEDAGITCEVGFTGGGAGVGAVLGAGAGAAEGMGAGVKTGAVVTGIGAAQGTTPCAQASCQGVQVV
jgi:hypothetical protein